MAASKKKPLDTWIWARATIHLPGFPAGQIGLVDTAAEYVQEMFAAGYLVEDDSDESA